MLCSKEYLPELSYMSYDVVVAVMYLTSYLMLMGAVFFVLQYFKDTEISNTLNLLSIVLLLTSFFMLQKQANDFADTAQNSHQEFHQGFRYMNWLLDIPILIILFHKFQKKNGIPVFLCILGVLMVLTGYFARFLEIEKCDTVYYIFLNVISILCFVFIILKLKPKNYTINFKFNIIDTNSVYTLFVFSWFLYIPAYFADARYRLSSPQKILSTEIVTQQLLFSLADILSKLVFSVAIFYANFYAKKKKLDGLGG